jgi:hypothetical protein
MTDHVTAVLSASVGSTAADICNVPPFVVIVAAPPAPVTVIAVTGFIAAGALTVKLTSKLAVIPLLPLTVTVAVYVPAIRLSLGFTVNVSVPPIAISDIDIADSVKQPEFEPLKSAVNAPVA